MPNNIPHTGSAKTHRRLDQRRRAHSKAGKSVSNSYYYTTQPLDTIAPTCLNWQGNDGYDYVYPVDKSPATQPLAPTAHATRGTVKTYEVWPTYPKNTYHENNLPAAVSDTKITPSAEAPVVKSRHQKKSGSIDNSNQVATSDAAIVEGSKNALNNAAVNSKVDTNNICEAYGTTELSESTPLEMLAAIQGIKRLWL
jgi:hypothetical protein